MQAIIYTAKQRGPVAVWNGWGEYSDAGKKTAQDHRRVTNRNAISSAREVQLQIA